VDPETTTGVLVTLCATPNCVTSGGSRDAVGVAQVEKDGTVPITGHDTGSGVSEFSGTTARPLLANAPRIGRFTQPGWHATECLPGVQNRITDAATDAPSCRCEYVRSHYLMPLALSESIACGLWCKIAFARMNPTVFLAPPPQHQLSAAPSRKLAQSC
jgi:hypothetical protein